MMAILSHDACFETQDIIFAMLCSSILTFVCTYMGLSLKNAQMKDKTCSQLKTASQQNTNEGQRSLLSSKKSPPSSVVIDTLDRSIELPGIFAASIAEGDNMKKGTHFLFS